MSALAFVISMVLRWLSCCMEYAASASAFFVSALTCISACCTAKAAFCSAIFLSASTLMAFASCWALAVAMAMSRCAFALAICAFFRICSTLSIPMFSMVPAPSLKFWILKFTTSIPSFSISGTTFSVIFLATPCRSWTISFSPTEPTISRIFPSKTWVTRLISSACFIPSRDSAARFSNSGLEEILMFATPSTLTLINSLVGTASEVFTSTCMTLRDSLSTRSKKGTRQPARPIRILFFPRPEIIYAVSGGDFRYPKMNRKIMTAAAMIPISRGVEILDIIISSIFIVWKGALLQKRLSRLCRKSPENRICIRLFASAFRRLAKHKTPRGAFVSFHRE